MCVYGCINYSDLSVIRKVILIMMAIGMLHEWEEKRWPGGFFETVGKVWGWDTVNIDMRRPGRWVVYAWLVITIIPFALESVPGLALAPVYLGFFEAFIHTLGGKLTKTRGKYFPGIVTAWCMAVASAYCLMLIKTTHACMGGDYLIGAIFILVVFMLLQNLIQLSAGSSMRKMIRTMRNR